MITGEKVILKHFSINYVNKLLELHNNLDIKKKAMFHPFPITLENDKKWMEEICFDVSNKSVYFAIEDKITNSFVGYVSLRNINWVNRNCFFGIVLLPEMQGKGFGKESTLLILNYGIKNLNMNKIQLEVIADNQNAIKLYRELGFVEEGTLRNQYYFDGFYYDVIIMSYFRKK